MIHHNLGTDARRIAVIQVPRPINRRLGGVRSLGGIRTIDWTVTPPLVTLTDEPQSTADQWIGDKIQSQSNAVATTPGTLSYNPVPNPAPLPIGRWNSWNGPCGSTPPTTAAPSPSAVPSQELQTPPSSWVILAAVLGAAASGLYLLKGGK